MPCPLYFPSHTFDSCSAFFHSLDFSPSFHHPLVSRSPLIFFLLLSLPEGNYTSSLPLLLHFFILSLFPFLSLFFLFPPSSCQSSSSSPLPFTLTPLKYNPVSSLPPFHTSYPCFAFPRSLTFFLPIFFLFYHLYFFPLLYIIHTLRK